MPDPGRSLLFKAGRGAVDAQSRINSHQIDENDVDLRARITQITNTISSSNPLGGGARHQQPSENFFSYPSFRAVTIGGGYAAGQVLGQELSLLTLLSSLCSPGDMELPINDPSLLQPTPFAPGQNAYSLHQYQHQRRRRPLPAVIAAPVLVPVPVSLRDPTALVAPLPVPAAIVAPVLFLAGIIPLTAVMPTATLLQKLSPANIDCDLSSGGVFSHFSSSPPSPPSREIADQSLTQPSHASSGGSVVQPMTLNPTTAADLNVSINY